MKRKKADPQALRAVCVCLLLALGVLAVFGQTARFEFVDYDDRQNVYENPVVEQGLSAHGIGWSFTHPQVYNWIPLTTLSHMLDCQVFGLQPGGHHLVNVLLHAANAILLFLVLWQMTDGLWRSAFVAALFALHPLRAESVAWVSERKDVLSGFFFLLTIWAYVRHVRRPSRPGYIVVVLFFALGLLAKSMVATLPGVLLLLDYWPLGRMQDRHQFFRLVREKIPLLALAAAAIVAAALVPGLILPDAGRLAFFRRLGNAVVSYAVYLRQTVFPTGLAVPYPFPPNGQPMWKICAALFLLVAISVGVIAFWKKRPYLLAGWLWYLGMLVPVIGIIQISADAAHADRYTYLPGIGLALAGTWAVADWSANWKQRRTMLPGLSIVVLGAFAFCGHIQTSYWHDNLTLWRRALDCTTGSYVAEYNMGNALVKEGNLEEAVAHFQKSLEIQPDLAEPRYNLANALFNQGKFDAAIVQYRKSLEIEPKNAEALNNLGNALAMKGADEEAVAQYQKALEIQPDYSDARFDLGQVLLKHGKLDAAILQFRKIVEIKPHDAEARNDLGKALLLNGDPGGANACFETAAKLSADPAVNWCKLGDDLVQKEDWKLAIVCYQRAIEINPRSADARAGLGMAFFRKGDAKEAIDSWQHALAIFPGQIPVLNNLAWLLATTPVPSLRDGTKAVALATRASQLSGEKNPVLLHTLAVAYAASGSNGLAAGTARRALQLAVEEKNAALAATLQKEIQLYETNTPPRSAPQ